MLYIALDDEPLLLRHLERAISEARPEAEVMGFTLPSAALKRLEAESLRPDAAFLDIEMPGMSGLELAKRIKQLSPRTGIVFVTGFAQYALDAYRIHARGYIMKPVTVQSVREELDNLAVANEPSELPIRVRCFGNFEVFCGGEPMRFQYSKTKELLAYLIDREGAFCTNAQIMDVLWEEQVNISKRQSYFRDLRADLLNAFKKAGCADAVEKQRGMLAIVPEKLSCDYFDWKKGDIQAINAYEGEYMTQYSWGEFTLGKIEDKAQK